MSSWFMSRSDSNQLYSHRRRLAAGNFGFKKNRNCTIRVAKTKALISIAVTAKLICTFVFAYAKCGFFLTQLVCKHLYLCGDIFMFITVINMMLVHQLSIFLGHLSYYNELCCVDIYNFQITMTVFSGCLVTYWFSYDIKMAN